MPCWGPITAYRPPAGAPDARLVFRKDKSGTGIGIKIPCGRCSGCRLEQSRQWAVRCLHEKRLHNASCFITLTYDNSHLPPGNTLVPDDFRLFMYSLRRLLGQNVRFFACGEYGDTTLRPHYHLLLLSHDFEDRQYYRMSGLHKLYTSKSLRKIWDKGDHYIGDVTFESAAYVARYCMKKLDKNKAHKYQGRHPEFVRMSRRPGLGTGYFDKYTDELLDHDSIIVNGRPAALPRFYDNKIAHLLKDKQIGLYTGAELVKIKRRRKITRAMRLDTTSARLRVRELVTMAKLKLKPRTL